MRRYVTSLLLVLFACFAQSHAAELAIPRDLEDWRGWVLHGEEFRRCPFMASLAPADRNAFRCAWPGRLALTLDARGGTFTQGWQVFAESWVRVPGNLEHWPQDVRVNGALAAIVAREGYPYLLLKTGTYAVAGKLAWSERPESLPIDPRTALVQLAIEGHSIAQPERPDGDIWLGKRRSAEQPARMDVQVYRLVKDLVPAHLVTRMRLQVSGEGREELLARVLPDGFTPLSLHSALPARLEPDGRLRVQVRAGTWEINLEARGTGVASRLSRPPAGEGLWAREEVWSYDGDDRLRIAAAQGAEGIDPAQANVPQEWRGYPAFRMAQDSTLEISERSRGLRNADDNRVTLYRQLWLDFDHRGLTAVDRMSGTMRKDWRLEMTAPYALQSARASSGDSLLITRNPGNRGAGLEVRSPQLDLEAVVRAPNKSGDVPATGWNTRFDQVRGQLNLPPGHRLLAALGADRAPDAWMESWGLWGLFGVLVVAVCAGWLAGRVVGVVAFIALLLTYQESPAYIWLWANLLVALALARAAPEGRLRQFARRYRVMSFALLGIALLPLLAGQARMALHPQLDDRISYVPMPQVVMSDVVMPEADRRQASQAAVAGESRANLKAPPPPAADMLEENVPAEPAAVVDNPYGLAATAGELVARVSATPIAQRYAPGTLVQAGPGIPAWRYIAYPYEWSGPVDPSQSVHFVFIGPVLLGLWRFAGIALLVALFIALYVSSDRGKRSPPAGSDTAGLPSGTASGVAHVLSALFTALLLTAVFAAATPSRAEAAPDSRTLEELKSRLTQQPGCSPTCADITSARVTVRGESLEVSLQVSALADVAVPMPAAGDRWQLGSVTVDDRPALAVGREPEGALTVALTPGAHTVRLTGVLPDAESISLDFPSPPRSIAVTNDGWDVTGVNDGRLLSGSLELVRRRTGAAGTRALETAVEFPAFVHVTRAFDLGLDWSVATTVARVAPERAAMTVEVPLLKGESALSEGLRTRDLPDGTRLALVGLERGQREVSWSSGLARSETLELEVPADSARAEVWSFVVSPEWNITFDGLPAVFPENINPSTWLYEFHPRPGEKLRARITRPERAEGSTLALDKVHESVTFGKRSASATLEFQYRSTQGGRHALTLPKTARVTAVHLDGRPASLRPDEGVLSIGLLPGSHSVKVEWETPQGAALRTQTPQVDLHTSASNVQTMISLPADRWPLFAWGAGVGPAFVYWSELAVFLITAVLLGRWSRSPLRTHEWLLLGLGLSTLSWGIFALVAIWLFALEWRQRWPGATERWRFNGVQVLLAALTVIAVSALVFSGIRQSLLASPDMGVTGPGSYGSVFTWFLDRTESALPQPSVVSVPMWVYRALMFAWALWLALALLRWLRLAWQAWKTHGIWRSDEAAPSA